MHEFLIDLKLDFPSFGEVPKAMFNAVNVLKGLNSKPIQIIKEHSRFFLRKKTRNQSQLINVTKRSLFKHPFIYSKVWERKYETILVLSVIMDNFSSNALTESIAQSLRTHN